MASISWWFVQESPSPMRAKLHEKVCRDSCFEAGWSDLDCDGDRNVDLFGLRTDEPFDRQIQQRGGPHVPAALMLPHQRHGSDGQGGGLVQADAPQVQLDLG